MRGREVIIKDTRRGLRELETLRELSQVVNARIYIGFEKHLPIEANGRRDEYKSEDECVARSDEGCVMLSIRPPLRNLSS
jgi:hypothetical protein